MMGGLPLYLLRYPLNALKISQLVMIGDLVVSAPTIAFQWRSSSVGDLELALVFKNLSLRLELRATTSRG